jgi:hypothetical protein
MRWKSNGVRVFGVNNDATPLVGMYDDDANNTLLDWQPRAATSITTTSYAAPYSRIEFGDTQCLRAPSLTVGTPLEVVDCLAYPQGSDLSLRFVFDGTLIKLYQDQTLCAGWTKLVTVETCDPARSVMQFVWHLNPAKITWRDFPGVAWKVLRANVDDVIFVPVDPAFELTKVDPTVKHLELDESNVRAEMPRNNAGDHFLFGHIFATACDSNNENQRFIFHSNGTIEVADGTFSTDFSPNTQGWCLDIHLGGLTDGTRLQSYSCFGNAPHQLFEFDAASMRMRWNINGIRVFGVNNDATPLVGMYNDDANNDSFNWRPNELPPPTATPTSPPTAAPTSPPTATPTSLPTAAPTSTPTTTPTSPPTATPTGLPTTAPTSPPTATPTTAPTLCQLQFTTFVSRKGATLDAVVLLVPKSMGLALLLVTRLKVLVAPFACNPRSVLTFSMFQVQATMAIVTFTPVVDSGGGITLSERATSRLKARTTRGATQIPCAPLQLQYPPFRRLQRQLSSRLLFREKVQPWMQWSCWCRNQWGWHYCS